MHGADQPVSVLIVLLNLLAFVIWAIFGLGLGTLIVVVVEAVAVPLVSALAAGGDIATAALPWLRIAIVGVPAILVTETGEKITSQGWSALVAPATPAAAAAQRIPAAPKFQTVAAQQPNAAVWNREFELTISRATCSAEGGTRANR